MKGSGKQILIQVLRGLSTKLIPPEELQSATTRIRAALLIHGSTSEDNFKRAQRLTWGNSPPVGPPDRQGIALQKEAFFISDFFEKMLEAPGVAEFVMQSTNLSIEDYESAIWAIWLLLSANQMFADLLPVEGDDSEIDVNAWIQMMGKKYNYFFQIQDSTEIAGENPQRD